LIAAPAHDGVWTRAHQRDGHVWPGLPLNRIFGRDLAASNRRPQDATQPQPPAPRRARAIQTKGLPRQAGSEVRTSASICALQGRAAQGEAHGEPGFHEGKTGRQKPSPGRKGGAALAMAGQGARMGEPKAPRSETDAQSPGTPPPRRPAPAGWLSRGAARGDCPWGLQGPPHRAPSWARACWTCAAWTRCSQLSQRTALMITWAR
jgi:hypothetical protein